MTTAMPRYHLDTPSIALLEAQMSDESSRSTRPSGQRRDDGAPVWWPELDRGDLPEDTSAVPPAHRRWYEEEVSAGDPQLRDVAGIEGIPTRRRAVAINVLVAVVTIVVLMLVFGADSAGHALVVGVFFGVPLGLVALTAVVVARRSR